MANTASEILPTVVWVEDLFMYHKIFRRALKNYEGIKLELLTDPNDAIARIERSEEPIALLVTDGNLNKKETGVDVARAAISAQIHVLVFSGEMPGSSLHAGFLKLGIKENDIFSKPDGLNALVARIKEFLESLPRP